MSNVVSARFPAARCALVLVAASLTLAACGSGGTSAPAGGNGSAPLATTPASGNSGGGNSGGGNSGASTTGTALFPVAVGNTWVSNISLGSTGHGTTTTKIVAVAPVSAGTKVSMNVTDHLPGLPTPATSLAYVFHPDGSITVPYVQLGNGRITVKSGTIVWPSQALLDSGQPHQSTLVLQINLAGHSLTVHAHVTVRGAGKQTVTVPAGTYQATVVDETIKEKVFNIAVTTVARTWLAPGVGPVKSEVLVTSNGVSKIAAIEALKSFTKG